MPLVILSILVMTANLSKFINVFAPCTQKTLEFQVIELNIRKKREVPSLLCHKPPLPAVSRLLLLLENTKDHKITDLPLI